MSKEKMQITITKVDTNLAEALTKIADSKNMSRNGLIKTVLENFANENFKKVNQKKMF